MNKVALISGIGLGAGLMYILDPDRGNRRRALMRNKCARAWHKTGDAFGTTSRDISNRTRGVVAEVSHLFQKDEIADDVLVERVRSKMGRVVSHPGSIEVAAQDGRVTLSGPILADEVGPLLKCVSSVRGVHEVDNRLEVHETAGDVPGLQGGSRRPGSRFELRQANWSPTARLLVGIAGSAMAVYGASRLDTQGIAVSALGLGLLARGATNIGMKRMVGLAGNSEENDQEEAKTSAPLQQATDTGKAEPEKHQTARQRL